MMLQYFVANALSSIIVERPMELFSAAAAQSHFFLCFVCLYGLFARTFACFVSINTEHSTYLYL